MKEPKLSTNKSDNAFNFSFQICTQINYFQDSFIKTTRYTNERWLENIKFLTLTLLLTKKFILNFKYSATN